MNIIDVLEQLGREAREDAELLEMLRAEAEGVGSTADIDDSRRPSGSGDRMEKSVIRLLEAEEEVVTRALQRSKKRSAIFRVVSRVCGQEAAELVDMRHYMRLTIGEIAEITKVSSGHVSQRIGKIERKIQNFELELKICTVKSFDI